MFADHLEPSACPNTTNFAQRRVDEEVWNEYEAARSTDACTRNGYERVNLTTGEVTRVWSETTPGKEATRYHDADRLNETHLAVADIYLDRVFVVNSTSDQTEWTWNASSAFPRETGGPYPEDWTHINDIEVLEDGQLMVSARNQDRVVFLNRSGLIEGWTLGEEDNYSILYEQHNPDYIPTERGGPAVLVGDSENNRVVEYQRTGDSWEQSWVWRDTRMQWPRDADRLPNGHTLITDSNGNRVFEVDKQGEVVWSVNIAFPYEAERLGTGDESAGGPSATQANLDSRTGSLRDSLLIIAKQLIPGKYLNGLMYITPVWMGFLEVLELVVLLTSCLLWAGIEIVWRRQS
ncbi:arylsulfotransferase family protein [Haloarcula sp. Atlit-7R]|uniref:arylsulfotransferase family protein n=1 Tax=Haloarcula sp. Atlit-7R TaxID=2282125 RepID=UPI001F210348|nr:arylsulfotransferase family protein [Haloarcula sp. Atlit-7R]